MNECVNERINEYITTTTIQGHCARDFRSSRVASNAARWSCVVVVVDVVVLVFVFVFVVLWLLFLLLLQFLSFLNIFRGKGYFSDMIAGLKKSFNLVCILQFLMKRQR